MPRSSRSRRDAVSVETATRTWFAKGYLSHQHPLPHFPISSVNLIGEHVDYTGGFVLPMCLSFGTGVVLRGRIHPPGDASLPCLFVSGQSPTVGSQVKVDLAGSPQPRQGRDAWSNYVVGVLLQFAGDLPTGYSLSCSAAVFGDVPLGSGLSSSASLEVSVATAVEQLFLSSSSSAVRNCLYSKEPKCKVAPPKTARDLSIARALRCQRAENIFCSSPCGIMDQYVSSAGSQNSALLIDCESNEFELVPIAPGAVVIVANSNVKHSISGGEYPKRVAECKAALAALQSFKKELPSLRHATAADVENGKASMSVLAYKRARHTVSENARTGECRRALTAGDFEKAGKLMNASHYSLRDDFEVSCKELDLLQAIAEKLPGVYGSRMTGGGFGGCTVTLCETSRAPEVMAALESAYRKETSLKCLPFVTGAGAGARVVAGPAAAAEDKAEGGGSWKWTVAAIVVAVAAGVLVKLARDKKR